MIIKDELPFSYVEGKRFRDFYAEPCPKFGLPSSTTIAKDTNQIYLDEK